jgi:hypothetical protein
MDFPYDMRKILLYHISALTNARRPTATDGTLRGMPVARLIHILGDGIKDPGKYSNQGLLMLGKNSRVKMWVHLPKTNQYTYAHGQTATQELSALNTWC